MDNQYSYYNPNETEGNTSNGTTFYNNGQGDDGKITKKRKRSIKKAEGCCGNRTGTDVRSCIKCYIPYY